MGEMADGTLSDLNHQLAFVRESAGDNISGSTRTGASVSKEQG